MKLELRGVACGYEKEKAVVTHVNMTVESGEALCLLGPNGVGKSTVFKTILGLLKPLKGQITIDGSDVSRWSVKKRASVMAYVSQAHIPAFPYLVKDIVMMGRMGQIRAGGQPSRSDYEITEQALEDVGMLVF